MEKSQFLHSLIHAKFNTTHYHDEFTEKAYFCGDCGGNSLTHYEKETEHVGHNVIRAMKNSNHYCYKKNDILSLNNKIDVSGVCCYIINSFHVYFPKSRVKCRGKSSNNGKQECCRTCGWGLSGTQTGWFYYCSILCKLECSGGFERMDEVIVEKKGVKKSSSKKKKKGFGGSKKFGGKSKSRNNGVYLKIKYGGKTVIMGNNGKKNGAENSGEVRLNNFSYRKRSRKGIPRRAPFY